MVVVYADAESLADRLSIPVTDDRMATLASVAEAASRWIDTQTGRRFYAVTETRYYTSQRRWNPLTGYPSGRGAPWALATLERPFGVPDRVIIDDCLSATSVATDEDGDGIYETTWLANSDYWLGPMNAPADGKPYRSLNRNAVVGRYLFPVWDNAISVTGSFGYTATTPPEIRELAMQVGELLARSVLDTIIPGVSTYKLSTELSMTVASSDLPMSGQQILANYTEFLGVL